MDGCLVVGDSVTAAVIGLGIVVVLFVSVVSVQSKDGRLSGLMVVDVAELVDKTSKSVDPINSFGILPGGGLGLLLVVVLLLLVVVLLLLVVVVLVVVVVVVGVVLVVDVVVYVVVEGVVVVVVVVVVVEGVVVDVVVGVVGVVGVVVVVADVTSWLAILTSFNDDKTPTVPKTIPAETFLATLLFFFLYL